MKSFTKCISVVIINLDGEEALRRCIESIEPDFVREIIVVDNFSTDGSLEMLRLNFPDVVIIRNHKNEGFAGPCNQGAANATGEFLLFLNNDAKMTQGAIPKLLNAFDNNSIAAVAPKIINTHYELDSAGSFFTWTGFLHHLSSDDLAANNDNHDRFAVKGACMLIKKRIFHEVGGFDGSFFAYFEETDLCWRLIAHKYRILYVDGAVIEHLGGLTTRKIFPSSHIDYLSFRNRILAIRRNLSPGALFVVLPLHVVCCLAFATAFMLSRKPKNAFAVLRGVLAGLSTPVSDLAPSQLRTPRTSLKQLKHVTVGIGIKSNYSTLKNYLVRW